MGGLKDDVSRETGKMLDKSDGKLDKKTIDKDKLEKFKEGFNGSKGENNNNNNNKDR